MAKKNFLIGRERELQELAERYEESKEKGITPYLDAYDYADLTDWYVMRQQMAQAEEALEDGLSMHPDSEALLIEKCHLLLDNGKVEEAYELSERMDTNNSDPAIILRGNILLQQGRTKEAKEQFERIHDKDELYNIIDICYAYLDNDYIVEASMWMEIGESKYGHEEPLVALKADFHYHVERYEDAIGCYNELIDMNPYSPVYWTGIARCYYAIEAFNNAIESCDYALVSDENYREALTIKAQSFASLDNHEESFKCYAKLYEIGALSDAAWNDLKAMHLMDEGRYDEAMALFRRIEKDPNRGKDYRMEGYRAYNMGLCMIEKLDFEAAHDYFTKATDIQPDLSDAYLQDGVALVMLDREPEALLAWEMAVKMSPTALTLFDLGRVCTETGHLNMAIKSFKMAKELNSDLPLLNEYLALVYLHQDKRKEFEEANRNAIFTFPKEVISQLYAKLDKATPLARIQIAQQYFEQYVLIPSNHLKRYS